MLSNPISFLVFTSFLIINFLDYKRKYCRLKRADVITDKNFPIILSAAIISNLLLAITIFFQLGFICLLVSAISVASVFSAYQQLIKNSKKVSPEYLGEYMLENIFARIILGISIQTFFYFLLYDSLFILNTSEGVGTFLTFMF